MAHYAFPPLFLTPGLPYSSIDEARRALSIIITSTNTMLTLTPIALSLSLLASQILAIPTTSEQSKHARWGLIPRTLQDPDFLKRDKLAARDVGFSPFDKGDIFKRACSATQITCSTGDCCPAADYCVPYTSERSSCCAISETCSGKYFRQVRIAS